MDSLNILFTGQDQVEVRREPLPPLGPDDVLIQTTTSLISVGTEMICLGRRFDPDTHWDRWIKYPFSPGYSLVGRIAKVGERVEGVREGDRVAARVPHRQYAIVPADRLYPVPDGVADEDAAWFGLATITQTGVRRAEHRLGDNVAVVGLGPLGQLVTQYARLMGARQVIAIDPVEKRLDLARQSGATATLALSVAEARPAIDDLTNGAGADVAYDVTGAAAVFAPALGLLRRFGRLVLLGDTGTPAAQHLTSDLIRNGLTIVAAHDMHSPAAASDFAPWTREAMAALFFAYLLRGDMRVAHLVTHRFAPADAVAAYGLLREDRASAMGVLFDWREA